MCQSSCSLSSSSLPAPARVRSLSRWTSITQALGQMCVARAHPSSLSHLGCALPLLGSVAGASPSYRIGTSKPSSGLLFIHIRVRVSRVGFLLEARCEAQERGLRAQIATSAPEAGRPPRREKGCRGAVLGGHGARGSWELGLCWVSLCPRGIGS